MSAVLPTQKTPAKRDLHEYTVLQYGPTKYGKTSWCAQAEGAVFFATEPGLNSLEVYQQPINAWEDLLAAAKDLADGKHAFRTVIIDTVDNAYRMCTDYVNKQFNVRHESELDYGKGYALVNAEFYRVLNKLALLPYGLFLVSHSEEKEIETRTGKSKRTVPTLPDKARKLVLGLVDIILFCDFEQLRDAEGNLSYRRVLRTKPTARYDAGDRTGRLPDTIEFDYATFVAAFQQGVAAVPSTSASASSSVPPAPAPAPSTTNDATPAPQAATTGAGGVIGGTAVGTTTPPSVEQPRGVDAAHSTRAAPATPPPAASRSPPPRAPAVRPSAARLPAPRPDMKPSGDRRPSPQPPAQNEASTSPASPSADTDTSHKEATP